MLFTSLRPRLQIDHSYKHKGDQRQTQRLHKDYLQQNTATIFQFWRKQENFSPVLKLIMKTKK